MGCALCGSDSVCTTWICCCRGRRAARVSTRDLACRCRRCGKVTGQGASRRAEPLSARLTEACCAATLKGGRRPAPATSARISRMNSSGPDRIGLAASRASWGYLQVPANGGAAARSPLVSANANGHGTLRRPRRGAHACGELGVSDDIIVRCVVLACGNPHCRHYLS